MAEKPEYGDNIKYGDNQQYAEGGAPASPVAAGHNPFALTVGGQVVTSFQPILLKEGYNRHGQFEFLIYEDWDSASYDTNQEVKFWVGEKIEFIGRIMEVDCNGSGHQGVLYRCLDNSVRLRDVPLQMSGTRGMTSDSLYVVFNAEPGELEYTSSKSDRTCGQIIKSILSEHSSDISGYIDNWNNAELNIMDITPPRLDFTGVTLLEAINEVVRFQFNVGWWFDPSDNTLHFTRIRKSDLDEKVIASSDEQKESIRLKKNITSAVTRVIIEGTHEVENIAKFFPVGGILPAAGDQVPSDFLMVKAWEQVYESTYTTENRQDDPARQTYGKVFSQYDLPSSHIPLLPTMVNPQASMVVFGYNPAIGSDGNWESVSAKANLMTGEVRVASVIASQSEAWAAQEVWIRYAYNKKQPLKVTKGFQGDAYTDRSYERTWPFFDPEYKKQDIYGHIFEINGTTVTDYTANFGDDMIGKNLNGKEITAVDGSTLTLDNVSGLSVGDTYHIDYRDDTDSSRGMGKVGDAILDMLDYEQMIGQIKLDGLDFDTWVLGTKVNVTGFSDSDFSSMDAPVKTLTWDFKNYTTIINLTSDEFITSNVDYEELKRRFLKKRDKAKSFKEISVASSGGGSATTSPFNGPPPKQTGLEVHDHSSDNSGGGTIKPNQVNIDGVDYIQTVSGTKRLTAKPRDETS